MGAANMGSGFDAFEVAAAVILGLIGLAGVGLVAYIAYICANIAAWVYWWVF